MSRDRIKDTTKVGRLSYENISTYLVIVSSLLICLATPAPAQIPDSSSGKDCPKQIEDAMANPGRKVSNSGISVGARLNQINGANSNLLVLTVKYDPTPGSLYAVYDGAGAILYKGSDPAELSSSLNDRLTSKTKTIYITTQGLSRDKQLALETSLQLQQIQKPRKVDVRVVGDVDLSLSFFDRATSIEVTTEPEILATGPKKGWFRILVELTFGAGKSFRKGTLSIFCETKQLAVDFVSLLKQKFAPGEIGTQQSVVAVVNAVRRDLKLKYPKLSDHQMATDFREQFGKNYLVILQLSSERVG